MGEIKSTLDLVLERTRHLSLSAEEKEQQQRGDFEKRLRGVLQQYAEGSLSSRDFLSRLAALQAELKVTDPHLVIEALFRCIDPDEDSERWLEVLAALAPEAGEPLREVLAAHRKRQAEILEASRRSQCDRLAGHGIQGSAVVPNPEKEPEYRPGLAALREETQARIEAIGQSLSSQT